jgi:glycosyltransferase involved in cell wall biosynthesis
MGDKSATIPVISIVTPSYNQGAFLPATIESVIGQEGDFCLDYLIIDGGSTDGSDAIIREYDDRLRRGAWPIRCAGITLRWLSEPDAGQADALIKGFRLATGDIFAWLNSDDTYLPGALQAAAVFFREHPTIGLMYGDASYCDRSGVVIGRYNTDDFDLHTLAATTIICQPAAFFRRQAFEAAGGLDGTLDFVMDYDLWIRIARRFPCHHLPQLLATYRLHETSKTISSGTLVRNCEEALTVTLRHFGWAPLTRVYTLCRALCQARLPALLGRNRWLCGAAASLCTPVRSIILNRGLHRGDLKLLNRGNFRKLFKGRLEIMTGRRDDGPGGEP